MPTKNEENIRHLLRRTEFADRQHRVDELMALGGGMSAAVDNVLAIPSSPVTTTLGGNEFEYGIALTEHWFDQMAFHPTDRPLGERMALFWHGHLCSEFSKSGGAFDMQDQIDLFRSRGLGPAANGGNIGQLLKDVSVQVPMLRYLDNHLNKASSPNQNFGRELMELFVLGVGNYTEGDVEAVTEAWTGHTVIWDDHLYDWRPDWHHQRTDLVALGQPINRSQSAAARQAHGFETIDVMLGTGIVGTGVTNTPNRGRRSRDVAAEFLSEKLWHEFAGTELPSAARTALRSALVTANFDIRPWVRALLLLDDFYTDEVKQGLIRQPVDYAIATMVATGLPATVAAQPHLLGRAGQRPLYPPNVSGWKRNSYWVNAGAMEARNRFAQGLIYTLNDTYLPDNGYFQLPGGRLTKAQLTDRVGGVPVNSSTQILDLALDLMDLRLSPQSRQSIVEHLDRVSVWRRYDVLLLILINPEMHLA